MVRTDSHEGSQIKASMGCNTSKVSPDDWASYTDQDGQMAWANLRTGKLTYEPQAAAWDVSEAGAWTNRVTGAYYPAHEQVPLATEVGCM